MDGGGNGGSNVEINGGEKFRKYVHLIGKLEAVTLHVSTCSDF